MFCYFSMLYIYLFFIFLMDFYYISVPVQLCTIKFSDFGMFRMNGKFIGVALFHTSVQKLGNYKS